MKNIELKLIVVFTLSVFWSCDKPIDIELGAAEQMIVLNSVINPDSLIQVNLTRNRHILDNAEIPSIEPPKYNPVIKLYGDDTYIEDLKLLSEGDYISTIYPEVGVEYSIQIEDAKLSEVKASCVIPEQVDISKIDTATVSKGQDDYYFYGDMFECKVTFKDPPGEDNYYMLKFAADKSFMEWRDTSYLVVDSAMVDGKWIYDFREVTEYEKYARYLDNNIYYDSDDISHEFGVGGASVFSDELFDGRTYSFSVLISSYNLYSLDSAIIYASLLSLSEDYYRYLKTRNLHYESKDDFFTTPVSVFNNIEGGVGVMGSYSTSKTFISVKLVDPWLSDDKYYYR